MENSFADVEEQYKKYPELKRDDIKILQEWISKQLHLPKITELKIMVFLMSCRCNIEATKRCIENYYTFRTHYPPLFQDRDMSNEKFQKGIKAACINTVKVASSNNRYVFLLIMDSNLELFYPDHIMAISDILTDLSYMTEGVSEGHVCVLDGSNVRLGHALKVSFPSLKVFFQYTQSALPVNVKEVHIVNVSPGLEKVFQMCKPLVGKELAKLIHIHVDPKNLENYIPRKYIPVDIGGEGPSFKTLHDGMVKTLTDHAEYIKNDALQRADECKRVGPSVDAGVLFGIEGTFKKLEID